MAWFADYHEGPNEGYECGWVGIPSMNKSDDAWRFTIAASEFADTFEVNFYISKANVIVSALVSLHLAMSVSEMRV